ncbi:hypothetical protein [Marinobacter sp. CHS3-4]|uniref:hypothetical protein n=1 Tax=Marinobacter sp. CHS3-4 TaxID=3045174 RepID=UPI0024B60061|nr:hypothetical protein [Marinobacter sp. CHS3-4]MDI9244974.1 hypothetical protein [Marinobacter sp. CHS3-4]
MGFDVRFYIAADDYGRGKAKTLGMISEETIQSQDVVIDAATIPDSDAAMLQQCRHRVLISPVCDRADLATHVLVRSVSKELRTSIGDGAVIEENQSFAFVTTRQLEARALDFDEIKVGICLSGGEDPFDLDELVARFSEVPLISKIYVLHHQPLEPLYCSRPLLVQKSFSDEPWSFFADINVFVGGDGLLISEAVAQGIPAISLTTRDKLFKNGTLISQGCLAYFLRDSFFYPSVIQLVSDRQTLAKMHEKALENPLPDGASLLAHSIHQRINI